MLRLAVLAVAIGVVGAFQANDSNRPHIADQKAAGIETLASMRSFKCLDGKTHQPAEFAGRPLVLALTGTTCPLAKKLGPTLASIEKAYAQQGVRFLYVNPALSETDDEARADAKRLGLAGAYVHGDAIAKSLGAKTTTECFLFDAKGKLAYRGAVDDQYGIGYSTDAPKHTYLKDAIEAVLQGRSPTVKSTFAPGCLLASESAEEKAVTYYGHIAKIIQDRCITCHRAGGVAPFSLEKYEDVKSRATMLKYAVEKGIMPPWFAAKGYGPWKNDRSLSDQEKRDLFDWIDSGTPEGDPAQAPAPRTFDPRWQIGKPDLIVKLPEPIKVKATGTMAYQNVTVPAGNGEDRWIQSLEIRPSARQVVHHVLIFLREKGQENAFNAGEEISGFFAAYVPGTSTLIYPDGFGKKLPAGASLKFQIHYTPNGTATEDQTELGLVFSKKPVLNEVHTIGIANLFINIPAGAPHHPETAQIPVPYDVKLMSFIPHMHVRGSAARYDLIKPDGSKETLLDVPRYDFNWQLAYDYKDLRSVPKGSRIEFTAWYDNSDKNPANPDPTKNVRWGLQTFDEMHLGYVEYIVPGAKPGEPLPHERRGGGNVVRLIFNSLDKNGDGFVTQAEAGASWDRVKAADADGDGQISLAEALKQFGG